MIQFDSDILQMGGKKPPPNVAKFLREKTWAPAVESFLIDMTGGLWQLFRRSAPSEYFL